MEVLEGRLLEEKVVEGYFKRLEEVALVDGVGLVFLEWGFGLVLAGGVGILLHFI